MTLLSAIQDTCDEIGVPRPSAIISSSDQRARTLLALVKTTCNQLIKRHDWSALIREATITTVNGTASYSVESDFLRVIGDTAWDSTNYRKMRGSLTPQEWQYVKRAILASPALRKRFRVKWDTVSKAREVFIDPTPTSAETLVYEYGSTHFCQATGGGATKAALSVDSDVFLLDEELIKRDLKWRYLSSRGQPYAEEKQEAERAIITAIGHDAPAETVDLANRAPRFMANLADGNWAI